MVDRVVARHRFLRTAKPYLTAISSLEGCEALHQSRILAVLYLASRKFECDLRYGLLKKGRTALLSGGRMNRAIGGYGDADGGQLTTNAGSAELTLSSSKPNI